MNDTQPNDTDAAQAATYQSTQFVGTGTGSPALTGVRIGDGQLTPNRGFDAGSSSDAGTSQGGMGDAFSTFNRINPPLDFSELEPSPRVDNQSSRLAGAPVVLIGVAACLADPPCAAALGVAAILAFEGLKKATEAIVQASSKPTTADTGRIDPTKPAKDVLPGSLHRVFPGELLDKSLNEIKDALRTATGAEKQKLQTAKKLLEQAERLKDKARTRKR